MYLKDVQRLIDMNNIVEELFLHSKVNINKLVDYGFKIQNNNYIYTTNILGNQMKLTVTITQTGEINTEVFDLECEEIYTLFLAEGASGAFVGEVRKEYEKVLTDIRNNCFDKSIFTSNYALMIIDYIQNKYGDALEFLWEKSSNNAVFRRKDNKKWYCAMLKVKGSSIGLDSDKYVEVIDFIEDSNIIPNLIDRKNYFPAYHMNKKHWLTILLNNCTLDIQNVFNHIDRSYNFAKKK